MVVRRLIVIVLFMLSAQLAYGADKAPPTKEVLDYGAMDLTPVPPTCSLWHHGRLPTDSAGV